MVKSLRSIKLSKLETSIQSFGAYSLNNYVEYLDSGIPFIRGINMNRDRIDFSNIVYITEKANRLLWKSEVKPLTILLSMSGTIGEVALASKTWKYPINSNQDIAKIHANSNFNSYYLYLFLAGKYGQDYLNREARGSVQQHVFLSQIENMDTPLFTAYFESICEKMVCDSQSFYEKSVNLYKYAEELLLNGLSLSNFQPDEQGINVKSLKDSFLTSGRLDAEYYQPKFDAMVQTVKQFEHNKLANLVSIKKSIEPGSAAYQETGIPFYRVSNLTKFCLTKPDIHIDKHEYRDVIRPKKDTILLTKDGTVGMAYKVEEDIDGITSGAVLHLNIKDKDIVLPDYLTLVLNSVVVQLQAERDAGGSIIQHWKPSEIEEVVIPLLDIEIQQKIAQLVQQSFQLKTESEKLLEDAKNLVEYAIENSEEKALMNYELGLIKE